MVRGLGGSKGMAMGGIATAGGTVKIVLVKQRRERETKGDSNDSGREMKCGDGSGREREEKRVAK